MTIVKGCPSGEVQTKWSLYFWKIKLCVVLWSVPVILKCWFPIPALNWPVISSIGRALHQCIPVSQRAWVRFRTSKLRTFWMVFRSEGTRRKVNLSTFLRQSVKAKRWMWFSGGKSLGCWIFSVIIPFNIRRRDRHFTWSSEPREVLAISRAKV